MIARLRRHIYEESVARPLRLVLWVPLVFTALPSLLSLIMLLDLLTALVWLYAPGLVSQQVLELWLAIEVALSALALRIAPIALVVLALHESVRWVRRRLRTDAASDVTD